MLRMGHDRKKTIEANKLNKDQTPDTKPEENKIALSTSNLPRGRERGIAKANAPVKRLPSRKENTYHIRFTKTKQKKPNGSRKSSLCKS